MPHLPVICWYSMGGRFNNEGVQHYIAQEHHKPDTAAELQDLANVLSGIILQLMIIDSVKQGKRPQCMNLASSQNTISLMEDQRFK